MFVVVLAQLERQPLKKKAFCKWVCSYKCSSCVSHGSIFFLAPSYFYLCGNTNFLNFFFLSEQA